MSAPRTSPPRGRTPLPFDRILAPSPLIAATTAAAAYRVAAEDAFEGARSLLAEERDAIFEIAMLMATAGGPLSVAETGALLDLVEYLEDTAPSRDDLGRLLRQAERRRGRSTVEERLRLLAGALRRRAVRHVAYKVAYTIRVSDLEANDDEADLDDLLVEVLDLVDVAGELASQVNDALVAD